MDNFVEYKWHQIMRVSVLLACIIIQVAGCSSLNLNQAKQEEDPYSDGAYLPDYSQVGWLWPEKNTEPVPYVPREGDMLFSSTKSPTQTFLYRVLGRIGLPHHILMVVRNARGELGTFEVGAGGDKKVIIRPILTRLKKHKEDHDGSIIYVRQIKRALTLQESQQLTRFADSQVGKSFTSYADLLKLGCPNRPLSTNGHGTEAWFCSQLVIQALKECGLLSCVEAGKIVPEDVFHDSDFDFGALWSTPVDWTFETEPVTSKPRVDPTIRPKFSGKGGAH